MKKNTINDFLGELKQARLDGSWEISKTQQEMEDLLHECSPSSALINYVRAVTYREIKTIQGVEIITGN